MQGRISISIGCIDVCAVPRLITCKFKDDPLVAVFSSSEQQLGALFVFDTFTELHFSQQIVQKITIVMVNCVFEALALLGLPSNPLFDKGRMVRLC